MSNQERLYPKVQVTTQLRANDRDELFAMAKERGLSGATLIRAILLGWTERQRRRMRAEQEGGALHPSADGLEMSGLEGER